MKTFRFSFLQYDSGCLELLNIEEEITKNHKNCTITEWRKVKETTRRRLYKKLKEEGQPIQGRNGTGF